jgi:hypothetical protein
MSFLSRPAWRVFLFVFAVGLAWAMSTGQIWEDYLITYRASKNLAEGRGLVFTEGERVHTFTSPLGVLLPAASYLATGRTSDEAALWIFRLMSLAALGGAAVLLWRTMRTIEPAVASAALLVLLLATDSKTVGFAVNGMETAFLLLFVAWCLWSVFTRPARTAVHLGLAWAGMMWTRPDCCIYIAVLAAGLLLFAPGPRGGTFWAARWQLAKDIAVAAAICAAVYLPWFSWAWAYYGTPVPHTITAKGLFNQVTPGSLARALLHFPRDIAAGRSSLSATFLPYYSRDYPWGTAIRAAAFAAGLLPALLWLLPFVRAEARVASLAYACGHFYLTAVVGFPVPWYMPQVALFGLVALTLCFGQAMSFLSAPARRQANFLRAALWLGAGGLVLGGAAFTVAMARQARAEMQVIELPVRTAIGHWLREHARSPRDTVFLEPLGFIGYYSGLKMLDYPGLSSPEVVAARRLATSQAYPFCWPELIQILRPDWLVLREFEAAEIRRRDPQFLEASYELVRTYDATAEIAREPFVPIRGFLEYNGIFHVYRVRHPERRPPGPFVPLLRPVQLEDFTTREAFYPVEHSGNSLKAHAPSTLILPVPAKAVRLLGGFGFFDGAYAQPRPSATDGAEFIIEHVAPDGTREVLLQRHLDPAGDPRDRGLQEFALVLPPAAHLLVLTINPGPQNNNGYDWTYWDALRFAIPARPEFPR